MIRICITVVLLTLVYIMTLASLAVWDVIGGVILSSGLLLVCRRFVFGYSRLHG